MVVHDGTQLAACRGSYTFKQKQLEALKEL